MDLAVTGKPLRLGNWITKKVPSSTGLPEDVVDRIRARSFGTPDPCVSEANLFNLVRLHMVPSDMIDPVTRPK